MKNTLKQYFFKISPSFYIKLPKNRKILSKTKQSKTMLIIIRAPKSHQVFSPTINFNIQIK